MRILMLAQFYPPVIGGEERHVYNLSKELCTRGHDVAVATLRQEDSPALEEDGGIRIHRIRASMQRVGVLFSDKGRQHAPPFPDPEALLALRRVIQQEKPDIIHAHNWIVHSFVPLKKWSKARLVVTLHDYSLVCVAKRLMHKNAVCTGPLFSKCLCCASSQYGPLKGVATLVASRIAEKSECQTVDMFLAVSQAVAEGTSLEHHNVPYQVIPNFIPDNLPLTCNLEHPLLAHLPAEDFLLFVGDLSRDKGIEVLLQAYKLMKSKVPLVLIGRPLQNFPLDIPSGVRVLQNWPHDAVMAAWKRCMLGLAPSVWLDPCPTVAMEAMSMSKPVIASRMGGLLDIIKDGETGLLVSPGDPFALQEAIESLLDNPERRAEMGMMARQRATEFQTGVVVTRIEDIYHDLVAQ